jgi:hypothetical protein
MPDPINITITPPDEIVLNITESGELNLNITPPDVINLTVNPNTVIETITIENTERILKRVRNNLGVTIPKGTIVYPTGGHGSELLTIGVADNRSEAGSTKTIGFAYEDIAPNSNGYVITQGFLAGFNTTYLTNEGGKVFLGLDGAMTQTEPETPDHSVFVGWLVKKGGAGVGSVYVLIQNGFEIGELHDVKISELQNGQYIKYDSALGYWRNAFADTPVIVLNEIDDVRAPSPADGEVLTWVDANSRWENQPPTGGGGLTRSVPSFVGQGAYFHGRHMYGIAPSSTANFFTSHNGYLFLYPVVSQEDITIQSMKVYIAGASTLGSFRILLYDSDDTTGKPVGTPLEESGTFGMSPAGIYTYVMPFNRILEKGRQYWVGVNLAILATGGSIRGFSPVYSTSVWTDITTTLNYPLLRVPHVVGTAPYDFTANPWTATNITAGSLGNAIPLVWMELA